MLSFNIGRPIGRVDNPHKKLILSIVDPDDPDDKKFLSSGRIERVEKCCRYHSNDECEYEECCDLCPFLYSEEEDDDVFKEYQSNYPIIPFPDFTKRFIEYICGPSGSGKSTMASNIATQFKRVFPEKKIFIFSRTEAKKDPAYLKLKPIQIDIDESLLTNPIDITQEINEKGCLIIFDDCETIHDDKLKKEIQKLMIDAMEVGRKIDCNLIITNHLVIPNDKKFARILLNEINMLTVFPKSGSAQQITYALKTYFGLSNKQIKKILGLDSRWVRISKNYPSYVLYNNGAYIN